MNAIAKAQELLKQDAQDVLIHRRQWADTVKALMLEIALHDGRAFIDGVIKDADKSTR